MNWLIHDLFSRIYDWFEEFTSFSIYKQSVQILNQNFFWKFFRKLDFCVCFKGFTGTTYANFQGTKNTVVSLFIFFILPYFTCHPSLYCVIALMLQAASFFILPWLPTTGGLVSEDIFNFDPILKKLAKSIKVLKVFILSILIRNFLYNWLCVP